MAARDEADKWAGEVIGALLVRAEAEREAFFRDAPCGPDMVKALRGMLHFYEGAKSGAGRT